MATNKLTDKQCRAAQPAASMQKLFDGGGLFLAVLPSGFKSWRLKYRIAGKEKQLTLGPYPSITLSQARALRDQAKAKIVIGVDPGVLKHAPNAAPTKPVDPERTFRAAAMRWHARKSRGWKQKYSETVRRRLETELFPDIGDMAAAEIKRSNIRPIIERIQDRGSLDQAHRFLAWLFDIFELVAVSDDDWDEDKANPASSLKILLHPIPRRKYRAITKLDQIRSALIDYEAEPHSASIKLASRLLALTAARPGTVRLAKQSEFHDLDGPSPSWVIPADKMKLNRDEAEQEAYDFEIPLSSQAVALVKTALKWSAGEPFLFPSITRIGVPITDSSLSKSYRDSRQFYAKHVPHGWRSSFSTIMNERAKELNNPGDREVIDLMLAHKPRGVEAVYNRAAYMPRRREIAQEWADLLCEELVLPSALLEGPRN